MFYSEEEMAKIDEEVAKLGKKIEAFVKLGKEIGLIKEEEETMRQRLEQTKKGYPAFWEGGGGMSNTGWAAIVAGPSGESLKPVYIRRRGELACSSQHALFIVGEGYHLIFADQHRGDYEIQVYKIKEMRMEEDEIYAQVELVCEFSQEEWDKEPPEYIMPAIKAARKKASCYHCREPHYMREDE